MLLYSIFYVLYFIIIKNGDCKQQPLYCIISGFMIYLLTAIGLTPGGSSTVHIYTQTVHRTTQWKQNIQNGTYITIRIYKHNKNTLFTKLNKSMQNIQPYIQWQKNGTKRTWQCEINEKSIKAANWICSVYLLIMLDTLLLRLSLHFTTLRPTTHHSTSPYFIRFLYWHA
jgi:hypothetical protein